MPGACSASSSWPKYETPAPAATIRLSYGIEIGTPSGRTRLHDARWQVEAGDLGEQHRGVLLVAQDVPQRRRDLALGDDAGRDLVEHRLEQVVGLAIDQRDVDRRPAERPRREQAAEAPADHHDPVSLVARLPGHRGALLQPAALVEREQQRRARG